MRILKIGLVVVALIGLGVFFYIKRNHNQYNEFICTKSDIDGITNCMERGIIYPQKQYDFFYKQAENPSNELLNNNQFFYGFNLAWQNCYNYSAKKECNLYNEQIFYNFRKNCTYNIQSNSFCVENYFTDAEPNIDNTKVFIKVIQKDIDKNKQEFYFCSHSLNSFYNKLPNDLKKEVPSDIQKMCSKK
jgi:hypothetical protein